MLKLTITSESYDNEKNEFVYPPLAVVELEHSLVALSKWESKYEKPFMDANEKTEDEILDYILCMCVDPKIPPEVFRNLSEENVKAINDYINSKQTATWFSDNSNKPGRSSETITSELIYYWMTAYTIPFECQYWHINRLLTLIRICDVKNSKPKKMSRSEVAQRNRELNEQRRQQLKTNG